MQECSELQLVFGPRQTNGIWFGYASIRYGMEHRRMMIVLTKLFSTCTHRLAVRVHGSAQHRSRWTTTEEVEEEKKRKKNRTAEEWLKTSCWLPASAGECVKSCYHSHNDIVKEKWSFFFYFFVRRHYAEAHCARCSIWMDDLAMMMMGHSWHLSELPRSYNSILYLLPFRVSARFFFSLCLPVVVRPCVCMQFGWANGAAHTISVSCYTHHVDDIHDTNNDLVDFAIRTTFFVCAFLARLPIS